ncbi:hypothetical protein C2R22_00770 [Salinigranum rubrum]|uniref:Four-carbon acid sugar kinase family protein n=1 Tax=Salinigranum rubrum TaxID=755307 RepID=A0A2I8VEL6_9EURY|nr:four-carbon acid sugar kinase family protein [Salinigranum rubrum]AUV80368.1 hypothetical protein C2R22_00770 [Salinigranum rubrum]
MTLTGLVVADDLTGASDTGHEFAARGCRTLVSTGGEHEADTDVLVVDTDSRYEPPEVAATAVRDAIAGGEHAFVYKKVDSTLRGNLVSEVDAALDATGAALALVAPASPRNGRTTAEGYHLVDGRLVTDTDAGADPDKPVETAHLPTRFADSAYRVSRLGTECVAAGSDAVESSLTRTAGDEEGPTVVVADATHERHLAALAEGAARTACDVLYVGSAGLARYVETPAPTDGGPEPVDERDRSVLCVVGSTSPTTREQLRALPEGALVPLDLATAVSDPDAASSAAATACADRLASPGLAVLTSAPDADAADRAIRAGRDRGLDGATVRSRVGRALGGAVERLWTDDPPESLFVTGGAVASDVLSRLGATGVALSGEAVEEGIPLGRVAGGVADGVPVVTKAGAFGGPGAIRKCAVRLGGRDDLR